MKYSLVVPVYRNEASLPDLMAAVQRFDVALGPGFEVVFVVDGSPDRSAEVLGTLLETAALDAQLVLLSRNFGSFAAIRTGLEVATGEYCAVMAADLQEPEGLILDFFRSLEHEPIDVAVGVRAGRDDPLLARIGAATFWGLYRRLVQREVPPGGIDVFACNRAVREQLLQLDESNSSLVGQLLWLGFRRKEIRYRRLARRHGRSAWTFGRKLKYLVDSLYAFSDLPIRLLTWAGLVGLLVSLLLGIAVLIAKLRGDIPIPGYAATVLTIILFAALNSLGLGIIGAYTWRAFENTKHRPQAIVLARRVFGRRP